MRSQCTIPDCGNPQNGRSLCSAHYTRWRRHGDPLASKPIVLRGAMPAARFWAKVNKTGPVPDYAPDLGPCWLWLAAKNKGYGCFGVTGKMVLAHRYAYELAIGPIPSGLTIDHLCRTPSCVNPAHLEPVTHRENVLRGVGPTAQQARKTHCLPGGHPLSGDNLYLRPNGKRECRTCRRLTRPSPIPIFFVAPVPAP